MELGGRRGRGGSHLLVKTRLRAYSWGGPAEIGVRTSSWEERTLRILTEDTKIPPNEDPVHTGDMAGAKSFGL